MIASQPEPLSTQFALVIASAVRCKPLITRARVSGSIGPLRTNLGAANESCSGARRMEMSPSPHSCTISLPLALPPEASQT